MRVEDLDGPRIKAGAAGHMLEELAWLGLTWEEPIVYQSQRAEHYAAAMRELVGRGLAYPCTCSRKDIASAGGAPHADDGHDAYPGTCRPQKKDAEKGRRGDAETQRAQDAQPSFFSPSPPLPFSPSSSRPAAWRVIVDDRDIEFDDCFAGPQRINLARACGDFVIVKNDGLAAYQLAVVVDDDAAGVDAIIRGDDLLESAARQIHLRRLLGLGERIRYWHLPLVIGPDGRRLAKRHGDTRLSHYRHLGATRERILGLLGYWSGLLPARREADMDELLRAFDIAKVPRQKVVFSPEDDVFLTGGDVPRAR